MAHCLFDSLRAVGLQHHYDGLTSVGVRNLAHLTVLTMEDFPLLGIQTMQDRTSLFHLIQALKILDRQTLQQGNAMRTTDKTAGPSHEYADKRGDSMSSVCRKLDFSLGSEPSFCVNPKNSDYKEELVQQQIVNVNNTYVCCDNLINSPRKLNTKVLGVDSVLAPSKSPSKQNSKPASRNTSGKEEKSCVQNVPIYQTNPSEYNYGLPQTSAPATPKRRSEGEPRIWVCIRKRPLTPVEERREDADVVSTPDDKCVIVHESKDAVDLSHYVLQHRFYFDHVFDEGCSNEEVYLRTVYPLVQHMLNGGSATCFAYGQTGSGKTHTMLGSSPDESGLYALAVRDIFTHLSTSPTVARLSVFVSFFEIYCGQLYDLLDHRKRLFAREDGQGTVHIAGLCHVRVDSVKSLLQVILRGTEERSQGSSGVNPLSSRSHAMLQIQLREPHHNIYSRMWFVDLAGSERASDARGPDRQSRIEGAEINQSLLAAQAVSGPCQVLISPAPVQPISPHPAAAPELLPPFQLKECIRSLDQEQSHTPFRQSKLTQVLRDSFVGDSMTCMIANISPVHSATQHTLNTLRYANRVKELKGQGEQRCRRRKKNVPSPKQNLSQSLSLSRNRGTGNNRGGLREKSPPKKPKRNGPVPTALSPNRADEDCAFLSSTPKISAPREDWMVRRLFHIISPVKRPPNIATHTLQNHQETEKSQFKMNQDAEQNQTNLHEWVHLSRNLQDQEKRRHLMLYHQHLQQFAPLMSSSQQSLNSSLSNTSMTRSSRGYLCATENMMASAVDMKFFLGQYKASANQIEPGFPNCEASFGFKHGKRDLRDPSEGTEVLSCKNATKCDRKSPGDGKKSQGGRVRVSEKAKSLEKERVNFGDIIVNHRKRFAKEPCSSQAQAEHPLSPVTNHNNSILTLSALDSSPLQITGPKYSENSGCIEKLSPTSPNMEGTVSLPLEESSVMEPMRVSKLAVDRQPATELFLQAKLEMDGNQTEDAVIPEYVGWEPEENCEESYLEVPQIIGVSSIPVAVQLHSQQRAESQTLEAAESVSLCAVQPTSALNDLVPYTFTHQQNNPYILSNKTENYLLSQMSTAPHPGNSGNSCCPSKSEREERSVQHMCTSENHSEAHWHIVQAHLESLKEMEVLSHKEGTLLIQQPDMAFVEYVQQLEEIMRKKAVCVQSMIAHLQPYLKSKHLSAHL